MWRVRILAGAAAAALAIVAAMGYFHLYHGRSALPAHEASLSIQKRLSAKRLATGQPLFIRIFKQEAELEVWMRNNNGWQLFEMFPVCRWSGSLGPKLAEGDGQTPEGFYKVALSQLNPDSRYHLAFNIGYPNAHDRALGRTGSHIMVHGACVSIGCFAMTDRGIDDIYRLTEAALRGGQSAIDVHIFPFRMTEANMLKHAASPWTRFWTDLKRGHDAFEARREVPAVRIEAGRYVAG